MYKHDHTKQFTNAARTSVALCALAALGGSAAQAQVNRIDAPSQLFMPDTTAQYPSGDALNVVPTSFTRAAGSNNVTFTATNPAAGGGFTSFAASAANAGPEFTTAPFGATGDILENTSVAGAPNTANTTTGPLRIDFQLPVAGFGLLAQDFNQDQETFTLNVFDATNSQLGTFTFGPRDNSVGLGHAIFVGAQDSLGSLISYATLSSLSVATGGGGQPNNGSNDFAIGRLQVQTLAAPVPEASTMVGFGLGLALFGGLTFSARKRKFSGA